MKDNEKLFKAAKQVNLTHIQKLFSGEHACRLKSPDLYSEFRRNNDVDPNVIFGIREKDGKRIAERQSLRYPIGDWTEEEASAHCEKNEGTFEAAKKSDDEKSVKGLWFVHKIEFNSDKISQEQVLPWLKEHGYEFQGNILLAGKKYTVIIENESNFKSLQKLDLDLPLGIVAMVGEVKDDDELGDEKSRFKIKTKYLAKQTGKRLVTGIAMEPFVNDTDNEFYTEEAVEKAAHRFMEHFRTMNEEHFKVAPGVAVVESYVTPVEMQFDNEPVKKGTWLITTKIHDDDIWAKVLNGTYDGYSVEGFGRHAEDLNEII